MDTSIMARCVACGSWKPVITPFTARSGRCAPITRLVQPSPADAVPRRSVTVSSARTTVVIVTHRAEILRHVERILCLQDGAQIGFGPRADILPRLYRGAGVAADPRAARIG